MRGWTEGWGVIMAYEMYPVTLRREGSFCSLCGSRIACGAPVMEVRFADGGTLGALLCPECVRAGPEGVQRLADEVLTVEPWVDVGAGQEKEER